jgi:sialate O-acetylesterase
MTMAVPGAWERAGFPGLDGVAWYRTSVTLSARQAGQPAALSLGAVDDADVTWVNGIEVGRTDWYAAPRRYQLPAGLLKEGRNTIAVRVTDGGGDGGIIGGAAQVYLDLGGERKPLDGAWRFRVAVVSFQPDEQHINKVETVAYNGMVNPLRDFPIRGVIWYQGESNANSVPQAAAYRHQFAALITSWRRAMRGSERAVPFLWAQLPNFGVVDSVPPATASWATLRESQTAALKLPRTGQAITIDVGEPANIHPRNKVDVGHRLALAARAIAYGESVEWRGPTYRRHSIVDGVVTIEFDHVEQGLVVLGDGRPCCFAVAGADRRWVWADARLDGTRVVLQSDRVKGPIAIRYGWSNSPAGLNLYSRTGLPAAPFRTDEW